MILVGVYQGTRAGLRNESLDALQAADKELANIHQLPGTTRNPCFIITQLPDGTLLAVGSSLYDLSNQAELEQLLEQVKATQMRDGILKDRQLRFLRLEGFPGERYAFMDISGNGFQRYGMLRWAIDCCGKEKILFGTDYPINSPGMYVQGVLYERLTEDERRAVFSGNFRRLTGMEM